MSTPEIATSAEQVSILEVLPILPIDSIILFPSMVLPLVVQGAPWVRLIDDVALSNKLIGVFWRTQPGETFEPQSLAPTGTAAQIVRLQRLPNGSIQPL